MERKRDRIGEEVRERERVRESGHGNISESDFTLGLKKEE